ncbi:MAG: 23S rRNA (guanosine(2251)-2'-O)-methyltransferase RlmB [Spirochaetales bacterium]|nr:23S rRNA (guanosine(2251)-2'-O)-methyltransferase RlmB [Spirochaetales bacterium]
MSGEKWLSGYHAVEELLASGEGQGELLYSRRSQRIDSIIELAKEHKIPTRKAGKAALDKIAGSENHRGLLFVASGRGGSKKGGPDGLSTADSPGNLSKADKYTCLEDFLAELPEEDNLLVLLLDGVTDPQNLGAILRSADLFDVDLVVIPERGSVGSNATVRNVSAGAASWVPLVSVTNLARAMAALKNEGFWIYGAMMDGERVDKVNLKGKTALIMGSEGKGLRRLVAEGCDGFVSIPTGGHIDSLNVSVATGILLYESRRQTLGK